MDIKKLSLLSFLLLTCMIFVNASETNQHILCLLQNESAKTEESFIKATINITEIPECQAYLHASKNTNEKDLKKARDDFYKTEEGKNYHYWQKKSICFKNMLSYAENTERKDVNSQKNALQRGVISTLFGTNYSAITMAQGDIDKELYEELEALIKGISPETK
jgi:hypothetical protein